MSGNPNMDGDPNAMGGDPNAMNGDPNAIGGESEMGEDPNIMNGEPDVDGGQDDNNDGGDSTFDIINQLSDEDREAVRSYAESMLNRDETNSGDESIETGDENQNEQPVMESVIFTKAQIKRLNENFGPTEDELNQEKKDRKPLGKKNGTKTVSKNSPFNSPKFK